MALLSSMSDVNAHSLHGRRQKEGDALHDAVLPRVVWVLLGGDLQDSGYHLAAGPICVHGHADHVGDALRDQHHADVSPGGEVVEHLLDLAGVRLRVNDHEVLLPCSVHVADAREHHAGDSVLVPDEAYLHVCLTQELLLATHGSNGWQQALTGTRPRSA